MILHHSSKFYETMEVFLDPSNLNTIFEGQVLSIQGESSAFNSAVGGIGTVIPSAGASTDIWAGLALNVYKVPSTAKYVDVITVPSASPYTASLTYAPVSPSTSTMSAVTETGTALTYNSSVGSGQYKVTSSTTITFNSAQAGNTYYVVYSYSLTVSQALTLFGDGYVWKREPSQITQTIGAVTRGIVYTDAFDASSNWYGAQPSPLYTGAAGIITLSSTSTVTIPGRVLQAPSNDFPYLGVWLGN